MATPAQFLEPGLRLGFLDPLTRERRQYTVVRPLGRGAFTQSFLASSPAGFAVLKASSEDVDLAPEAKLLRDLNHPNVVRFRGSAFDPNWRVVLAFDRLFPNPLLLYSRVVDVDRLGSHLGGRYHPLPVGMALDLLMDLLAGLEHLHEAGYVHGDVKPTNFMLDLGHTELPQVAPRVQLQDLRRGRARGVLTDFGSSWDHREDGETPLQGAQLTPLYAPPEALLTKSPESGRVLHPTMDTYAAALVFYLTLTGHLPYAHLGLDLDSDSDMEGEGLLQAKRLEQQGSASPIDFRLLEELRGFTLRGLRAQDLKARLGDLLRGWLHPDPAKRTSVAKARLQLEEAFSFTPDETGRLRQSLVQGHLVIPHESAS